MNTVIAVYYGSNELGIFSETYAWYMILSQLSVWGIHMAVVKYVPEKEDLYEQGSILKTGVILVLVPAILITGLAEIMVVLLGNVEWKQSMRIAFSGLVLLSINKVLLNYINAISRMVAYAILTSIRYAFFGMYIWFLSVQGVESIYLVTVFPVTEIAVFLCMLVFMVFRVPIKGKYNKCYAGKMAFFGTKLIPSYMVLELNTKVDVVCLGFLCADVSKIGIYSFAIFFTEGFYLLYVTIRKIVNPNLARANAKGQLETHIGVLNQKLRKYLVFGGIIAYIGVSFGYVCMCFIMNKMEYRLGVVYILIICFSIMLNGKSIVYGDLLAQAGFPLEESVLNVLTVTCNFMLNIIFIFMFETVGAAIATAISYIVFSLYLKKRVKRKLAVLL